MLKNFASSSIIYYTGVIWELTAVSFGDTEDEVPNRYRDERKGEQQNETDYTFRF